MLLSEPESGWLLSFQNGLAQNKTPIRLKEECQKYRKGHAEAQQSDR